MKIAIHHRQGSFSDRWIDYCKEKGIDYKIVNAYDSNIIEQIKDCNAFMWHHHHANSKDVLFAKQLIYSLETAGIKCFPNFKTTWHFDDKVGQKYLLEATGAPFVPSYVFYSKKEALNWITQTKFPKVFKLRGGAGSKNVMLVRDKKEANNLINKAFGKGFPQTSIGNIISEDKRKLKEGKMSLYQAIKDVVAYYLKPGTFHKSHNNEKGYAYFQDFIENNSYDIRIVVIEDKAFYLKRMVRKGDFRASGSGNIIYERDTHTENCVRIAFETEKKIESQCTAYDFIFQNGIPLIVEISYGFAMHGYDSCEGYYTSDMEFHPGAFNPQGWMVENLIK